MLSALLRTLLMYGLILLAVRVMGKRQISQLQTSELVVTLLISELAVLPIQNREEPLWNGLIPMAAIVFCELAVSFLMLKSQNIHRLVCGKPMVVIQNGQLLQENMRRLRMSTEDLFEELRLDGVFRLEDVAWAVMETNGTLSVLRRTREDALTPAQAGVAVREEPPEVVVVSDGEIAKSSLALCGRDEAWARRKIEEAGLVPGQVFLMTASPGGAYRILPKSEKKKAP